MEIKGKFQSKKAVQKWAAFFCRKKLTFGLHPDGQRNKTKC